MYWDRLIPRFSPNIFRGLQQFSEIYVIGLHMHGVYMGIHGKFIVGHTQPHVTLLIGKLFCKQRDRSLLLSTECCDHNEILYTRSGTLSVMSTFSNTLAIWRTVTRMCYSCTTAPHVHEPQVARVTQFDACIYFLGKAALAIQYNPRDVLTAHFPSVCTLDTLHKWTVARWCSEQQG